MSLKCLQLSAKPTSSFFRENRLSRLPAFVRLELDLRCRKLPIKAAPPSDRPPFIEEDLDQPPISDPGEDDKALLEDLTLEIGGHCLACND